MPKQAKPQDFPAVFEQLKSILQPYAPNMTVSADTPEHYSLDVPFVKKFNKAVFFGGVQINKNYVSFHLMPVYMAPDLLDSLSQPLKKRMQGKACFNFKSIDAETIAELARLTQAGIERWREFNA